MVVETGSIGGATGMAVESVSIGGKTGMGTESEMKSGRGGMMTGRGTDDRLFSRRCLWRAYTTAGPAG